MWPDGRLQLLVGVCLCATLAVGQDCTSGQGAEYTQLNEMPVFDPCACSSAADGPCVVAQPSQCSLVLAKQSTRVCSAPCDVHVGYSLTFSPGWPVDAFNSTTASDCCASCNSREECHAWQWDVDGLCQLLPPLPLEFSFTPTAGVVSGLKMSAPVSRVHVAASAREACRCSASTSNGIDVTRATVPWLLQEGERSTCGDFEDLQSVCYVAQSALCEESFPSDAFPGAALRKCVQDEKPKEYMTIHLLPHTHDDTGWLFTAEEYYDGSGRSSTWPTINRSAVRRILSAVVADLSNDHQEDSRRQKKFVQAETYFLKMWWDLDATDEEKQTFKQLLADGRVELINGAWTMNDEALPLYTALIDQFTLGHDFLQQEFGAVPRMGWMIDPFGHTHVNAQLHQRMGFDAQFMTRIDFRDMNERRETAELAFMWRTSEWNQEELFTHVMYNHYDPHTLIWESLKRDNTIPYQDLVDDLRQWNDVYYGTGHVLVSMGNDFTYDPDRTYCDNSANTNGKLFAAADSIIDWINTNADMQAEGIQARYSTLSEYHDAFRASPPHDGQWPVKGLSAEDRDFLPYLDCNTFAGNCDTSHVTGYWSGYYVSRTTLKRLGRVGHGALQQCKQLNGLVLGGQSARDVRPLDEAVALYQHHDAITGTCKQIVADDYVDVLSHGLESCDGVTEQALRKWTGLEEQWSTCRDFNETQCDRLHSGADSPLLGDNVLVFYNPLSHVRREVVRVPVLARSLDEIALFDHTGTRVERVNLVRNCLPSPNPALDGLGRDHSLLFEVDVPPLGMQTFLVRDRAEAHQEELPSCWEEMVPVADASLDNGVMELHFSDGRLHQVTRDGLTRVLRQDYMYYTPAGCKHPPVDGSRGESGIYLFRPGCGDTDHEATAYTAGNVTLYQVPVEGDVPLVQEVHQVWRMNDDDAGGGRTDWVHQTVRLYQGATHAELEYTIGQIPLTRNADGSEGREVITRFDSDVRNGAPGAPEVWTDSNGREMVLRTYKFPRREGDFDTASANYFPVVGSAFLEDVHDGNRLSLVVDRPGGVASLRDGQVELMLHRRFKHTGDNKGNTEPLNEPGDFSSSSARAGLVSRGTILLQPPADSLQARQWRREHTQRSRMALGVHVAALANYTVEEYVAEFVTRDSLLMPEAQEYFANNTLSLMTVAELSAVPGVPHSDSDALRHLLVRLDHTDGGGGAVRVDLRRLFPEFEQATVRELSLSANQVLRVLDDDETVDVAPMDIRTFALSA